MKHDVRIKKTISLLLVVLLVAMIPVAFVYAKNENPAKGPSDKPDKGAGGDTIPLYVYVEGLGTHDYTGDDHVANEDGKITQVYVFKTEIVLDPESGTYEEIIHYYYDLDPQYNADTKIATFTFMVPFGESATVVAAVESGYTGPVYTPSDTIEISRFNKNSLYKACTLAYTAIPPST